MNEQKADVNENIIYMPHVFDIVLFSVVDPGQQLNQLMQSTMKAASHGLQHLFRTTKDVIKTLQAETVSVWAFVSAAACCIAGLCLWLCFASVGRYSGTHFINHRDEACLLRIKSQLGSLL